MPDRIALTDQWEEPEPGTSVSVTRLGLVQEDDGSWSYADREESLDGGLFLTEETVGHGGAFADNYFAPRYFAPSYWVEGGTSQTPYFAIADAEPFNLTPLKIGTQLVVRE